MELPQPPKITTDLANSVTLTNTKVIASYYINSVSIVLSTSASINVFLCDASGSVICSKTFIMENPNYSSWGCDDSVVKSFVESQISALTSLDN